MAEAAVAAALYGVETVAESALALAKGLSLPTAPLTTTMHRIRAPPLPRSSHTVSVVRGRAYIFGGEVQPRQPVDNAMHMVTLPTTGKYEEDESDYQAIEARSAVADGPVPAARVGHSAAVIGDRIYVYGGRGGKDMKALDEKGRVWVFDTTVKSWSFLDPMEGSEVPPTRSYHTSVASPAPAAPKELPNAAASASSLQDPDSHGTVFIHAGCLAEGRANDLWSFDVGSRSWAELPSAPGSARGGTSLAIVKDRLYRFGGFDGTKELGGQIDFLDLASGTFSDKGGKGEMALMASPDGWRSNVFAVGSEHGVSSDGPTNRSVAGMVPVSTGQGRHYLLIFGGETTPSDKGHDGAGRFLGDVWSFQLRPEGNTAASWKDAVRSVGLGKDTGERQVFESRVKTAAGVLCQEGQGSPMGARGWFGSDALGDVGGAGAGVVVWGGLDAGNARLGDGWVLTVE